MKFKEFWVKGEDDDGKIYLHPVTIKEVRVIIDEIIEADAEAAQAQAEENSFPLIFDLTNAKLPKWWKESWPLKLPVRKGQWRARYDLIKDRIDKKTYKEMWDVSDIIKKKKNILPVTYDKDIPMGIGDIPEGAIVREAKKGEYEKTKQKGNSKDKLLA